MKSINQAIKSPKESLPLFYIITMTCSLLSFNPIAAQTESKDIRQVKALLQQQTEAWNQGDIEGFMEMYWKSDQLEFVGSSGLTKGWEATINRYRKRYPGKEGMGELKFKVIKASKQSRKVISLVGQYHLERKGEKFSGYFLLVWRKIKGQWLIVSDCTAAS